MGSSIFSWPEPSSQLSTPQHRPISLSSQTAVRRVLPAISYHTAANTVCVPFPAPINIAKKKGGPQRRRAKAQIGQLGQTTIVANGTRRANRKHVFDRLPLEICGKIYKTVFFSTRLASGNKDCGVKSWTNIKRAQQPGAASNLPPSQGGDRGFLHRTGPLLL